LWWIGRPWTFVWGPLSWEAIAVAVLLFFGGMLLGMWLERHDIGWATFYGRWVLRRLERWLQDDERSFGSLVLLISSVNAGGLALIVMAAHIPPLSALLLLLTGLNTGVMAQRIAGRYSWLALLMPHAWIEIPAVICGSAAALQASAYVMGMEWFDLLADTVWAKAFYLRAALPLLIGAAMLEAMLMVVHRRQSDLPRVIDLE
jgi:uncharacterized membrane protein SpoIIM required for sporulation